MAVLPTLPLGGERTGQRHPHCHLTSNVPKRYARLRVAVWVRAIHGPAGATPTLGRASSELSLERWAVSERGASGFGSRHGGWTIRRAATPARDGPPASREVASPRPGDGGAVPYAHRETGTRDVWTATRRRAGRGEVRAARAAVPADMRLCISTSVSQRSSGTQVRICHRRLTRNFREAGPCLLTVFGSYEGHDRCG